MNEKGRWVLTVYGYNGAQLHETRGLNLKDLRALFFAVTQGDVLKAMPRETSISVWWEK